MSEAVGSLCDNTAQPADFVLWGIVWSDWKERAHPGPQSALLAPVTSELDISRCLSVVINSCEVSQREGEAVPWLMFQVAGKVHSCAA